MEDKNTFTIDTNVDLTPLGFSVFKAVFTAIMAELPDMIRKEVDKR